MNKDFLSQKLQGIYESLADDESRELFIPRFEQVFRANENSMIDMMEIAIRHELKKPLPAGNRRVKMGIPTVAELLRGNQLCGEREVILWGAGGNFQRIFSLLQRFGVKVSYVCDSDVKKQGTTVNGLLVISPEEFFDKHRDCFVGCTVWFQSRDIVNELLKHGFPEERMFWFVSSEKQYFGPEFIAPLPDEVYVDVGCFSAGTIKDFIKLCDGRYKRIYGIEADKACYQKISDYFSKTENENICLVNKGAWSKSGKLSFHSDANGSISQIHESGESEIDVSTIDEIVQSDKVTFIKMDIEGAELEALHGAANTIRANKPRLAISIYHKPEDIADIPAYIKDLVPGYRFYIRQYSYFWGETILYAVL